MPWLMKYLNRDGFMLWKKLEQCSFSWPDVCVKGVTVYAAAVLLALYTRNASAEDKLNTNKG